MDDLFGDLAEDLDLEQDNTAQQQPADPDAFQFFEYHKLELTKGKIKLPSEVSEKETWVVLEKVHGANFSFYCNGRTIACSRRNSLLADHESFFNFQQLRDRYHNNIIQFYNHLKDHLQVPITSIAIFGELFGGFYPHPTVTDLGLCPVQKEIYYSDKVEFYAFDVSVNTEDGTKLWLNYDVATKFWEKCGFFWAQPLLVGTLAECLKFNYAINTTIPQKLGLPLLEKNLCEGVVVKSVEPLMIKKGGAVVRAIYKMKNAKFTEVNPRVESLYEKNRTLKQQAITTIYDNLERYINHNRMVALKSKIGEIGRDRIDEAVPLFLDDVISDFSNDFTAEWTLVAQQHEQIKQNTRSKVNTFVAEWVKNNST
jgi:Rnl2 family RNA ligase